MRGHDADEPAPHVLRTNDIDAAGSVAAAATGNAEEVPAANRGVESVPAAIPTSASRPYSRRTR